MRKWIYLFLLLLLSGAVAFYFFIPRTLSINERTELTVNEKAFARVLFNEAYWPQWWPGEKERVLDANTAFVYNGNKYTVTGKRLTSLLLTVSRTNDSVQTELFAIPVRSHQVEMVWTGTATTGTSPVEKFKRFKWAKSLSADFRAIMQRLQTFYKDDDHLYGFPIRETIVVDSLLVMTATTTKMKPSTADVYALVDKLKAFVQKAGAKEMGEPMLNTTAVSDSAYLTRVAIPVDRHLMNEGDVQFKQMLGRGNILVTDVKGGPVQIEKAFAQTEYFVQDYNRTAPAIPYQKLITDRRAEPDTAKWVTKIYWPVM